MCLAREHELNRHPRVVDEADERFEIAEHEVCALVGSEAPREPNGECVEAERMPYLVDELERLTPLLRAMRRAAPGRFDELGLQRLPGFPQLAILDAFNR